MLSLSMILLLALVGAQVQDDASLFTTTHHFQHLNIDVEEVRTVDRLTGEVIRKAYGPDGARVDLDALRMEEQQLKIVARGKISPELGQRINASTQAEVLPVVFWLRSEPAPDFRRIMEEAVAAGRHREEARRMARDAGERFFSPGNRAFAERLAAQGYGIDYVGTCWPIVFATLPAAKIAFEAGQDQVDQAYYAFPDSVVENHYAQPTLRTPTVYRRGNTGGAGAVKVMVQDPDHAVQGNPYLPPMIWLNSGSVYYHATAVAGNICMQNHPTLHGCAPGLSEIYSGAGHGDVDAPAVWDLAMQAGVSFGNCSWWNSHKGSIVFLDRFFDYIIRNYGVLMFKSNGNQGDTSTPYSTSPGNGYNMLCTGCYSDNDTYKWNDDYMVSYSSYWNPAEGHEKPEVASPGYDVDTTATSAPWVYTGFGGTSSASPLTLGVATLVANRDPSIITHPEAVKAVLMVSAWHNVEGEALLSDKDGAGGVHAGAADAVARDGQYETGTFTNGSFPFEKTIHCYQGDGTRVICLWQSDPDSIYSTDLLKMDLDITVLDPNNQVVTSSASPYNPFELVYFEPAMTGDYTVRLTKQTFLGTSEPYCLAWSSRQDTACAEVTITGTGEIGSNVGFAFFDPYAYNERYVGILSLSTLPDLIDLKEGYILPVNYDALAYACHQQFLPGFVGNLDANGNASAIIQLPLDPGLIGTTIYCSMVTLQRKIPSDTAEVVSFMIN